MSKSTNRTSELVLLLALLIALWWYASTQLHIGLPGTTTEQTKPVTVTSGQHAVTGGPSLSADQVDAILSRAGSPAAGTGQTFYEQSLQTGINDAYALAFYGHESSYGLAGVARFSKSIGNLRCIPTADCVGGYAYFSSWEQGITAWYSLIRNLYINTWHLATVETIIPKYAPADDHNNEAGYINSVVATVASYER
jgi:hypothetical protein